MDLEKCLKYFNVLETGYWIIAGDFNAKIPGSTWYNSRNCSYNGVKAKHFLTRVRGTSLNIRYPSKEPSWCDRCYVSQIDDFWLSNSLLPNNLDYKIISDFDSLSYNSPIYLKIERHHRLNLDRPKTLHYIPDKKNIIQRIKLLLSCKYST